MPRNGPLDEQRGHGRSHESRGADALDQQETVERAPLYESEARNSGTSSTLRALLSVAAAATTTTTTVTSASAVGASRIRATPV